MMLLHLICLALICPVLNAANKCVKIETPLCQELVGSGYKYAKMYNMTMFPNILSHRNQEEAGLEVHQFFPLIKVACSEFLQLFLCSVYLPVCTNGRSPIPPCRSLCEKSRSGCLPLMASFGFQWPEILNCKKFPENNGKNLCIDVPTPAGATVAPKNCTTCVNNSSSTLNQLCKDHDLVFVGKVLNFRGDNRVKFKVKKEIKVNKDLGRAITKRLRQKKMVVKLSIPKTLCSGQCAKFEMKKEYVMFVKIRRGKKVIYKQAGVIPYQKGMSIC
eukprot:Seg4426.2 transcript_id=Seg4426.2/GoldUCD/mRNA.D3Y31 product=Frizzled-1 protein_id=Seg4426.2/GoldUCD/D3Y31